MGTGRIASFTSAAFGRPRPPALDVPANPDPSGSSPISADGDTPMVSRCAPRIVACVWALSLPGVLPGLAVSGTILDDDFTGNSGGIPIGWSGDGTGSIIESGTTVTLHDDFAIWTNADFDVNQSGITTVRVAISPTTEHTSGGLIDFLQWDNHFWVKLHADGMIEVKASDLATGEEEYVVGQVVGYTGGATWLTVNLSSDSFAVSTDVPSFSSGPLPYETIFTTFTRDELGHAAKLVIENECSPRDPPCSSEYDRVVLAIGQPTSVESASFGRLKAFYR